MSLDRELSPRQRKAYGRLLREADRVTRAGEGRLGEIRPKGEFRFQYDTSVRAFSESTPSSAEAPRLRHVVQARLADEPTASFRDDLARKKSLRQVMGPDAEGTKCSDGDDTCYDEYGDPRSEWDDGDCYDADGTLMTDETRVPTMAADDPGGFPDLHKPDHGAKDSSGSVAQLSEDQDESTMGMKGDSRDNGDETDEKVSKAAVNYRYAPAPEEKSCGNCRFFREPGSCTKVAGLIRRIDVSDLWELDPAKEAVNFARVKMHDPYPGKVSDTHHQDALVRQVVRRVSENNS